jgi:hypothetical protein
MASILELDPNSIDLNEMPSGYNDRAFAIQNLKVKKRSRWQFHKELAKKFYKR